MSSGSERDLALTMPAVTVFSKPYGEPMASTGSPTRIFDGSPSRTVGRSLASMRITAISVCGSLPSTLALNSRRSVSLTVTSVALSTTWAFVRIRPSGLTMKPEPSPFTSCGCWLCGPWNCGPKRLKNWNSGSSGSMPGGTWADVRWARAVTLMLTTAGPN